MGFRVDHLHGWVVGVAGLATVGLLVSVATAGHGRPVSRSTASGPSLTRTVTAAVRAAGATRVGTVTGRARHTRAIDRPAGPTRPAPASASCRDGYLALTFDDGPDPASTPRLLAALRRAGLRATFFDIGQRVAEYPTLVRQTAAEGNAVEDHTWDHRSLTGASTGTPALTPHHVLAELERAKRAIASATGRRPRFFRPPYGDTSPAVRRMAGMLGLIEVGWSVDSDDYTGLGTRQIVARVLQARAGAVVVMHDTSRIPNTIAAIPAMAAGLRARGLCPGRLVPSRAGTRGWVHGTFHAQPAGW
jgi:peptidoglycan/xylan/chitin deacetylase (PgdA/CDA1 family)